MVDYAISNELDKIEFWHLRGLALVASFTYHSDVTTSFEVVDEAFVCCVVGYGLASYLSLHWAAEFYVHKYSSTALSAYANHTIHSGTRPNRAARNDTCRGVGNTR
jgi:hypothetical protein